MAQAANQELVDLFEEFFRRYYSDEIGELVREYPRESKSLELDWRDLYQMDPDLADDFINHPDQLTEAAEEALRLYDLPVDVSLGQAHVRVHGLAEHTEIRDIRSDLLNTFLSVQGLVKNATDVDPKIQRAVFVCQRCGMETEVPQGDAGFQEPYQCESCERQGPFKLDPERSEFVDAQKLRIQESPERLAGGVTPQSIDIHIEDDITGEVTAGDHVTATGVLRLDQSEGTNESPVFDLYMEGDTIESNNQDRPTGETSQPTTVANLDSYSECASTALATLPEDIREEETKAKLITPFVTGLGWNKFDSQEVRLEYTDSKTSLRPDYALFGPESEAPDVIIEAKQVGTNLNEKEHQLYDYLRVFTAEWGVLSNGEEFYVYHRTSNENLPTKMAEIGIRDLSEASIVDSLRRGAFYE